MIFEEYVKQLNKFLEKHPEAKKFPVIYSSDDEGNNFTEVYFGPTLGHFDKPDFWDEKGVKEIEDDNDTTLPINAVCIN